MNAVYILEGHVQYEGFTILGVYDSEIKAISAKKYLLQHQPKHVPWTSTFDYYTIEVKEVE